MQTTEFRRSLIRWYSRNGRKLPWRRPMGRKADGYSVLVSEAMLQQTQVATVIDYYHRFMKQFPTLRALAAADPQQVLRAWQGLGYYRRATHLHRLAQRVVAEHDGRLPRTVDGLLKLPGVGRYTAGAIASIAFAQRSPVVDGNVARVLSRLYAIDEPIDRPDVQRRLWELAESLLPQRSTAYTAGDFNQAMMELGAMVCTPRSPRCDACPVRRFCRGRQQGVAEKLPIKSNATRVEKVTSAVLALHRNGRYLFQQRGENGLWSGMWQLLTIDEPIRPADLQRWCDEHVGLQIDSPGRLGRFVHQTTHRTITFEVYTAEVIDGRLKRGAGRWRSLIQIDDLPLPRPQQRAIEMIGGIR